MKYAVISDLHANVSALRHVLADAAEQGAERVVCLGDVVGYGPLPRETLTLVRQSAATVLAGNHDDAVSARRDPDDFNDLAAEAVARHRAALTGEDRQWLASLPHTCAFEGAAAAHGDFTDPPRFNYVQDEDAAAANFRATEAQLLFVGHTHVPRIFLTGRSGAVYAVEPQDFVLEDGKRYIVNPGSVGYPREENGICRSSYVLYDTATRTVTFRFLPFAVGSVMQRGAAPNPRRRRRSSLLFALPALAVLVPLALAGIAFLLADARASRPSPPPAVSAVPTDRATELVLTNRTLTLGRSAHQVRAGLKAARRGGKVVLHVVFKSPTGETLGEDIQTIFQSTGGIKVPPGAVSAHFTVRRQKPGDQPQIVSFEPTISQ